MSTDSTHFEVAALEAAYLSNLKYVRELDKIEKMFLNTSDLLADLINQLNKTTTN